MFGTKGKVSLHPAPINGDDLYAAEAILDSRVEKDGSTKYLIKWLGWGRNYNTWEPPENIASESLIEEYNQRKVQKKVNNKHVRKATHQLVIPSLNSPSTSKSCHKSAKSRSRSGSAHDSSVKQRDVITNVKQTKSDEREEREGTDMSTNLRSRSNSRSSSRRNSHNSSVSEEPVVDQMSVRTPIAQNVRNLDSSKSKPTLSSKNIEISSERGSDSSPVISSEPNPSAAKPMDCNKSGIGHTVSEGCLQPEVVVERLPKLLFKRYQNSYEIQFRTTDQMESVVQKEKTSEAVDKQISHTIEDINRETVAPIQEIDRETDHTVEETVNDIIEGIDPNVEDNVKETEGSVEDLNKETDTTFEVQSQVEEVVSTEEQEIEQKSDNREDNDTDMRQQIESTSQSLIPTDNPIEMQTEDAEEEVTTTQHLSPEVIIPNYEEDIEEGEVAIDVCEPIVISNDCAFDTQLREQTSPSPMAANISEEPVDQNRDQTEGNTEDIEEGEIAIEVCEPIVTSNGSAFDAQLREQTSSSPIAIDISESPEEQNMDQTEGNTEEDEEMVEITVELSDESLEIIKNSDNDSIVVEMVGTVSSEQSKEVDYEEIDLGNDFPKAIPLTTTIDRVEDETSDQEVTLEDSRSVSVVSVLESEVIVDEVEDDIGVEEQLLTEPIVNNDDSIDANLMVRQPSNEPLVVEESTHESNSREKVEDSQQSDGSDALKKGSSEKSLSFKNLINNQNKCFNKNNDLLDLTFNDDIMLDTVANNSYINSCQRVPTGAKNLINKSDALGSGNYSPISDDEKCWTSPSDSQSSPESVIVLTENRSDSRKKTETQQNIEKTSDGRPVGDGATGAQQTIDRLSSRLSEPTPPPSTDWAQQTDLISNRVQTISFHRSVDSPVAQPLPAPPSVNLAQPPVTSCLMPAPPSQRPTAQMQAEVNRRRNASPNGELQTTYGILAGYLNDKEFSTQDSTEDQNRLTPNHQNNKDRLRVQSPAIRGTPSPADGSPQKTVITTLNSVLPVRSTAQSLTNESAVADASSWPVLNQTNLPLSTTFRPNIVGDRMTAPHVMSYNNQCMTRTPTSAIPQRSHSQLIMENQMRASLTEFRPMPPQEVKRRGRPPSIPQVRSHPYIQTNTYTQLMPSSGQYRQPIDGRLFPTPQQMMPMRTDIMTSNSPTVITTTHQRYRSTVPSNINPMRPELRGQSQYAAYMSNQSPEYRQMLMRQMSAPTAPTYGQSNQIQRSILYESNRPVYVPPNEYNAHLQERQHRPQERPLSMPIQRPYPYQPVPGHMERHPYRSPSSLRPPNREQSYPSLQPPYMSAPFDSNNNKITVEPKQSTEVRDKVMQTMATSHQGSHQRRHMMGTGRDEGQEFNNAMRIYQQKLGNNDNLANRERQVEGILDPRFNLHGIPYNVAQSPERHFLPMGHRFPNQMINPNMNRIPIPNISEPNPQILRSVLSQSTDPMMSSHPTNKTTNTSISPNMYDMYRERPFNVLNDANQLDSLFISDSLSPNHSSHSSSRTSKMGDKDILSEAMEEIVEYTEGPVLSSDEGQVVDNSVDKSVTFSVPEVTPEEAVVQTSTEEESPIISIPFDPKNPEELLEYLKSQGFQVSESDSQESQSSDTIESKTCEPEPEIQSENDLVIQIDEKMLAEVTGDGNGEVLLVFDDNNNGNQTEENSSSPVGDKSSQDSEPNGDKITDKTVDDNNNYETNEEDFIINETVGEPQEVVISDAIAEDNPLEDISLVEKDVQNDSQSESTEEPIHYVSMPTFRFDSDNQNKSQPKQSSAENTIQSNPSSGEDVSNVETQELVVENEEKESNSQEVVEESIEEETEPIETNFVIDDKIEENSDQRVVEINLSDISEPLSENRDKQEVDERDKQIDETIDKNLETTEDAIQTNDEQMDTNEENIETIDENEGIDREVNDLNEELDDRQKEEEELIEADEEAVDDMRYTNFTEESVIKSTDKQNGDQNLETIQDDSQQVFEYTELLPQNQSSDNKSNEQMIETDEEVVDKTVNEEERQQNDSGIGPEIQEPSESIDSVTEDIREVVQNIQNNLNNETKEDIEEEEEEDIEVVSDDNEEDMPPAEDTLKSSQTVDKLTEPPTDDNQKDESSDDKREENPNNHKNDETTAPTDVPNPIQRDGVQHPFVSSSVEDFMPNSPSILSSKVSSPLTAVNCEQKSKSCADVQSTDANFLPDITDSDEEVIPLPTTTTISSNSVQITEPTIKSSTIKSLNKSKEVPQISHLPIDNTSNQSKKSPKVGEKRKSKLSSKPPKKLSITEEEEREYLHLIKSRPNGWDKGWIPEEIVGINSLNTNLVFLVKWTNSEQTIVLSEVAKHRCPQLVIKFYEKHSVWDD